MRYDNNRSSRQRRDRTAREFRGNEDRIDITGTVPAIRAAPFPAPRPNSRYCRPARIHKLPVLMIARGSIGGLRCQMRVPGCFVSPADAFHCTADSSPARVLTSRSNISRPLPDSASAQRRADFPTPAIIGDSRRPRRVLLHRLQHADFRYQPLQNVGAEKPVEWSEYHRLT